MKRLFRSTDFKVYLSLFAYATAILFVISPDSYTHDIFGHYDSACFFMCGKAWMNGMVPYVDFADSKGPLLWLIYGVGYLIDHYTYIGVYWLSCLSYSLTFFLCYKTSCMLVGDRRKAYIVALLMAFPYFVYFLYAFDYEIRAEDFCQPFVCLCLYSLVKEILRPTRRSSSYAGVAVGLSFMATLLIKWSIAVMMLSFAVSFVTLLLRRRQSVGWFSLYFVVSALVLFMPFGVYMFATGSFDAFVNEYFINTMRTVSVGDQGLLRAYFRDFTDMLQKNSHIVYVFYILGVFIFFVRNRKITILPLLCAISFLAISIRHDISHYITIVSTFSIFFVAMIVTDTVHDKRLSIRTIAAVYVVSAFLNFFNAWNHANKFYKNEGRKEFYDIAYLMSQTRNPTILNAGIECGLGMPCNALPGTKYWTRQTGVTEEMIKSRVNAAKKREATFVTVYKGNSEEYKAAVKAAGYHYYMTYVNTLGDSLAFYGPSGLKMPPKGFKVSNMDILLKRKIKFADED